MVYIGFVALVQQDMKKLIAYSSIAHMGFVTLGSFAGVRDRRAPPARLAGAAMGLDGAMVQMISHGLDLRRAVPLRRRAVRPRAQPRRSAPTAASSTPCRSSPRSWCCSPWPTAGLPGTSGFVGEFLVILAAFKANFWYAFLAATTLILGAAYTLWLVKRVIFGAVANDHVAELQDLNGREFLVLGVLAVGGAALGVWPAPLLDVMRADHRASRAADHGDEALSHEPGINHTARSRARALPEIFLLARDLRGAAGRPVLRRQATAGRTFVLSLLALAGASLR